MPSDYRTDKDFLNKAPKIKKKDKNWILKLRTSVHKITLLGKLKVNNEEWKKIFGIHVSYMKGTRLLKWWSTNKDS